VLEKPAVRSLAANGSYLDRDTLDADELWTRDAGALDFEAELNRFLDAVEELVQGARLRVAAVQLWHAGDVEAFGVSFDDDGKFAFHGWNVAEIFPIGEKREETAYDLRLTTEEAGGAPASWVGSRCRDVRSGSLGRMITRR